MSTALMSFWDKLNGDGYVSVSLCTLITNNCVKLIDLSCSFTGYDTSNLVLLLLEIWSGMLVKSSNITIIAKKNTGWTHNLMFVVTNWSMKNNSEITWYYGSALLFLSTLDNWRQAPHTKSNNTALCRTANYLCWKGIYHSIVESLKRHILPPSQNKCLKLSTPSVRKYLS